MAKPKDLAKTIDACIKNGERLIDESYNLEFTTPPSSRFFLIMIAQEELAKAFILYLVEEAIVPFSRYVLRAINDHTCKQLVGMIMDYIIMHWENTEELEAAIQKDVALGDWLPNDVGSAMELLRYEKIERWESGYGPIWAEDPKYDPSAMRIAEGEKDRHKQDALYVRIGRDGRVSSTPEMITEDETSNELARVHRYRYFLRALRSREYRDHYRYEKAIAGLKSLFSNTTPQG
jgi:AbiV family abortive infection protein